MNNKQKFFRFEMKRNILFAGIIIGLSGILVHPQPFALTLLAWGCFGLCLQVILQAILSLQYKLEIQHHEILSLNEVLNNLFRKHDTGEEEIKPIKI